eukprot:Rmarinus@m.17124
MLAGLHLYRAILREHKRLPVVLGKLGDKYVKSEFRLHKNSDPEFVDGFLKQWNMYLDTIREQVKRSSEVGKAMPTDVYGKMSKEQKHQLALLFREAKSS